MLTHLVTTGCWGKDLGGENTALCIYILSQLSQCLGRHGWAAPSPSGLAIPCWCQPAPSRDVQPQPELSMLRACRKACPAFPARICTARARRTSDPSFLPYCFNLSTGARNSSELTIPPGPDSLPSLVVGFPPGYHIPRGAMGKEEAPLGSEPAFQQCGRTCPRSLGGRGTLGFAPLLERGNQEQKQLAFHAAVWAGFCPASSIPTAYREAPAETQSSTEHLLSPGINWLLVPCSSPATWQGETSKPQLLSETQNSHGLTKKEEKDNGTATTTAAAHCHISEGHPQTPSQSCPAGITSGLAWVAVNGLQARNPEAQKKEVDCLRTWLLEQWLSSLGCLTQVGERHLGFSACLNVGVLLCFRCNLIFI